MISRYLFLYHLYARFVSIQSLVKFVCEINYSGMQQQSQNNSQSLCGSAFRHNQLNHKYINKYKVIRFLLELLIKSAGFSY